MAGTSGTRDGWNQWDQGWLEPVGPGKAGWNYCGGTRGTRDGRNQWDQGWQELVVPGIAGTSGTKDGRSHLN